MKGCFNIILTFVLGISMIAGLLCCANGLQRIIAYGDWVHGIQTFSIGCILMLIICFVGSNVDE